MKISNFPAKRDLAPRDKMQNSKLQYGFTLIEILAVIFVLSVIGVLVAAIIVSSLRGINKTNTITAVRQNGFYAISQMTKMIQNAKRFEGASRDRVTYYPNCVLPTAGSGTPTPVPQQYKSIKIISFDETQTIFACQPDGTTPANILSNSALLFDTTIVSLDYSSCYFTCTQDNVFLAPTIGIYFSLAQLTTRSFFEQKASIPFQTTVGMRNAGR